MRGRQPKTCYNMGSGKSVMICWRCAGKKSVSLPDICSMGPPTSSTTAVISFQMHHKSSTPPADSIWGCSLWSFFERKIDKGRNRTKKKLSFVALLFQDSTQDQIFFLKWVIGSFCCPRMCYSSVFKWMWIPRNFLNKFCRPKRREFLPITICPCL